VLRAKSSPLPLAVAEESVLAFCLPLWKLAVDKPCKTIGDLVHLLGRNQCVTANYVFASLVFRRIHKRTTAHRNMQAKRNERVPAFFTNSQASSQQQACSHVQNTSLLQSVVSWGRYDGCISTKVKASAAFILSLKTGRVQHSRG